MKQSRILNVKNSGYYSGTGAITFAGPGYKEDESTEYFGRQYDFSYKPMGYADQISKDHDIMQEVEIVQPQGWLEDTRTLKSDRILVDAIRYGLENKLTNSKEDLTRTKNMKSFFNMVMMYKEWKVRKLESQGYDINNPEHQNKVLLKDWRPSIFKTRKWIAKQLLKRSGGGGKSREPIPERQKEP